VSSRRHLALLVVALALVAFGLASRGPAAPPAHDGAGTSQHAAALTATAHLHPSVVARTLRHPLPGSSVAHTRGAALVAARALLFAPARVLHRHTPLYTLLGVYRL
jgi:hypothetical protein